MNDVGSKTPRPLPCPHCEALSKLPDRAALLTALGKAIESNDDPDVMAGLFLVDFDALNRFNDVYGLDIDDRLIHALSVNIRNLIGPDACLAWLGGSRMAIVAEHLRTRQSAETLARQLQHLFSDPLMIGENLFYVTSTIGIALSPTDTRDAYTLLKMAESTVRRIKLEGKNLYGFSQSISGALYEEQIMLMRDLPAAIENGEVYFAYQCQYDDAGSRCIGAEMLARWNHPTLGSVPPYRFIPLAEQSGMIGPLTIKAMIDASKMFEKLAAAGRDDIALSINISPVFLMEGEFLETVRFMVENYGLQDRKLNFEITEEHMMFYPERLYEIFEALRALKIGIQIDDFGTGYASLKYLTDLPADTLKIDRSFVRNIDRNSRKRALFKAIVEMASVLSIDVIAEGIETVAEHTSVQAFEGVVVQGFYYSMPVEGEVFSSQFLPNNA